MRGMAVSEGRTSVGVIGGGGKIDWPSPLPQFYTAMLHLPSHPRVCAFIGYRIDASVRLLLTVPKPFILFARARRE